MHIVCKSSKSKAMPWIHVGRKSPKPHVHRLLPLLPNLCSNFHVSKHLCAIIILEKFGSNLERRQCSMRHQHDHTLLQSLNLCKFPLLSYTTQLLDHVRVTQGRPASDRQSEAERLKQYLRLADSPVFDAVTIVATAHDDAPKRCLIVM